MTGRSAPESAGVFPRGPSGFGRYGVSTRMPPRQARGWSRQPLPSTAGDGGPSSGSCPRFRQGPVGRPASPPRFRNARSDSSTGIARRRGRRSPEDPAPIIHAVACMTRVILDGVPQDDLLLRLVKSGVAITSGDYLADADVSDPERALVALNEIVGSASIEVAAGVVAAINDRPVESHS